MPRPLLESELIFTPAASSLKTALGELKRSNLSISNRLRSIAQDADFVLRVSYVYKLPLVANERCGSWYIQPSRKAGSAYFKSTDGHFGQWSFSLRRLNLQILEVVGRHGGCIIVDSTRRGKSMPDALSKTVPIWIAVLNRLLFPDNTESHGLHTPPDVVSRSEHSQIGTRIPDFVESLRALDVDVERLRSVLHKPMRPVWITPGTEFDPMVTQEDSAYYPVVLLTASNRFSEGTHNSSNYVQGAADDSESWAHGLDPPTFWAHQELLMAASDDELPAVIKKLVGDLRTTIVRQPTLIAPTRNVWVANNAAAHVLYAEFDVVVCCSAVQDAVLAEALKSRYIHIACGTGKNGSRQLRTELPKLQNLSSMLSPGSKILVTCETGKDLAVGAALAMLCSLCNGDGMLRMPPTSRPLEGMSKALIKHRLSWIMVSMPDASPSRATLQSVNACLMG